ncbi:MAG: HEAT repeat domain-containing protein, partial [Methanobacteriota archaeon]
GENAIEAILPYVDCDDRFARKFAIDLLAQLPAQDAIPVIVERLNDIDINVISAAIDALGNLNATEYTNRLLELYDLYPVLRSHILAALAKFQDENLLPLFQDALGDEDPVIQLTALEGLTQLNHDAVIPFLIKKVDDMHESLRAVVLKNIISLIDKSGASNGRMFPPHYKEYFLKMLEDQELEYVEAGLKGLSYFADDEVVPPIISKIGLDKNLDQLIFNILKTSHLNVLGKLWEAVESQRISPQKASYFSLALLIEYARSDENLLNSKTVLETCENIIKHFHVLDIETKLAAIKVFLHLKLPYTTELYKEALEDLENMVRLQALEGIAEIGIYSFIDQLQQLTEDEDAFIREKAIEMLQESGLVAPDVS